jgi:hypothetical protein
MHCVTRRSHRIQKQKFGVNCPGAIFIESVLGPPEYKNSASMFHGPVLRPNRLLIVCVPRKQNYTHTIQKIDTE